MALINEYLNASAAKINIPTPFILKGQAPLDLRQIVQKREDLTLANFYDGDAPFWYPGMLVSCVEDSKVYILKEKVEVDETTQEEIKSYKFVEVTPDLPENATKNTTYDLAPVANADKGQIQLSNSDDASVDTVYIEGGSNISVSSTTSGITVAHTVPTEGTALTAKAEEKAPGYAGTFTAVTGLKKDTNGHIIDATLETIKLPSEQPLSNYKTKQTAIDDVTASGTATTAVTSVTQNANGEITVTKANLPSVTDDAIEGQYVSSVTQTNGQITVSRASLPTFTESFTGVKVNNVEIENVDGKVNWGLNYNSDSKHIEIVDLNDNSKVMDYIDATAFIKDGMLSSGELVWCTIDAEGKHTEVAEGTAGAVHCLKLTLHVWERGLVDENDDPIYTEQYVHIPLGELCDIYTGAANEITVSANNVIGLANKTVGAKIGDALTPAHEGSFNVVTAVETDTKGRVSSITTTQVTLPSVQAIEDEITENAAVTAAALNDLNTRLNAADAKERVTVVESDSAGAKVITQATTDGVTTLTAHIANEAASFKSATPNGGDYIATAAGVKDYVDNVLCWQEGSFPEEELQ